MANPKQNRQKKPRKDWRRVVVAALAAFLALMMLRPMFTMVLEAAQAADTSELEQQIRDSGLENDFLLLGVKPNPFPYCKQSDFYVHATGFEGKSIAIQEAQTLGKPILATDCSGNREQIEDGVDGRLCPLTPEDISKQLLWMVEHPEECRSYGEKAEKKVLYHTRGLEEFLELI